MKTYVICFKITGKISVKAENEEAALHYFNTEDGQAEAEMSINQNQVSVVEIYAKE